jgi:hypothetical protein
MTLQFPFVTKQAAPRLPAPWVRLGGSLQGPDRHKDSIANQVKTSFSLAACGAVGRGVVGWGRLPISRGGASGCSQGAGESRDGRPIIGRGGLHPVADGWLPSLISSGGKTAPSTLSEGSSRNKQAAASRNASNKPLVTRGQRRSLGREPGTPPRRGTNPPMLGRGVDVGRIEAARAITRRLPNLWGFDSLGRLPWAGVEARKSANGVWCPAAYGVQREASAFNSPKRKSRVSPASSGTAMPAHLPPPLKGIVDA